MLSRILIAVALAILPIRGMAAPTACPEHFLDGQAPDLTNPKLAARARPLCVSGYVVLHSGVMRTRLWAADQKHDWVAVTALTFHL